VAGVLFLPFMFFAPIIGMVPPEATAPALIIVGFLMIAALTELEEVAEDDRELERRGEGRTARRLSGIDFSDLAIGLPAALTIMVMPFSFSITNGIGFGFIAYVLIRIAQAEWRRVHPFMWVAASAFALYFLVPLLQDNFGWI
jgi:AGZA family xanthine/uracil permease-like MFS transporter